MVLRYTRSVKFEESLRLYRVWKYIISIKLEFKVSLEALQYNRIAVKV